MLLRPAFANSPIPFAPPEGATSISRSSSQKKRAPARKLPMAEVASDKSGAKAGTVLESRSAPEQSLSHLPQHRRCACRGLQQRAVRSGEGEQRGHDPPSMYQKPRRGFAATSSSTKEFVHQASLTAHWHNKGADWRGLAHTQAHNRSRLSDSVKNGNALRTMHNAALPAR